MNTNIKSTNSMDDFSEILTNTVWLLVSIDKKISTIQKEITDISIELQKLSDRVEKINVCQPLIKNKNIFVNTYPRFMEENRPTLNSINPSSRHREIFPSLTY